MAAGFFTIGNGNYNMEREKTGMFGIGIRGISFKYIEAKKRRMNQKHMKPKCSVFY